MPRPSETLTLDLVKADVLAVLTNVVIFILGCWTWNLFRRKVFFVCCSYCCPLLRLFVLLLFGCFVHPPIAYAVVVTLMFWSTILWCEVVVNEIREFKSRWFGVVRLAHGKTRWVYWKVAAVPRPPPFDRAVLYHLETICDPSVPDDPFWPNHVSAIFVVELRRRNMIWTTLRIWQVSLLNGGKKISHQFHHVWPWTDGRPFEHVCTRAESIDSFQSRGVIFIMMRQFKGRADDYAKLFVYDTRVKKSAVYDMKLPDRQDPYTISITCISRLVGTDGSVEGWRIRILDAAYGDDDDNDELLGYRARIINEIYELRREVFFVKSEEIVFGRIFDLASFCRVRTSRGHFGLQAKGSDETQTPIVLFNETTSEYAIFRTLDSLILMDTRLATYVYSFPSLPWCYGFYFWPAFLNDREAMMVSGSGLVLRTTFRPSSLKYLAAKSLFQSNSQLRNQLNAEQFRQATGIGGMEGHFG